MINSFIQKCKTLRSYSLSDGWLFIVSWVTYLKWDTRISFINYTKWQKHLSFSQTQTQTQTQTPSFALIKKIIIINEAAGRNHLRKMNCLRRCLCQKELLAAKKIASTLHIGVKFVDGKLAAHSWLSVNNTVINDSESIITTYTELTKNIDAKTLAAFI